jgi:hypothetical protein
VIRADRTKLEGYNAMNAVGAKNAEFAFVIAAEVDQPALTLTRAGKCNLMDRSNPLTVFVFEQDQRLARHRRRQTKVGKLDDLAESPFRYC